MSNNAFSEIFGDLALTDVTPEAMAARFLAPAEAPAVADVAPAEPAAPAVPESPAEQDVQPAPSAEQEATPTHVLTPDGKRTIKWEVMGKQLAERDRAIAELKRELAERQTAAPAKPTTPAEHVALLEKLKTEYGDDDVVRTLAAAQAANEARMRELEQQLAAERDARMAVERDAQAQLVQADHLAALESTPRLAKWLGVEGPLKQQALEVSDMLMKQEGYKHTSDRAAHYADVEAYMADLLGLPTPAAPAATPSAKATLKTVPATKPLPLPGSISDIAGGTPPVVSEATAYEAMTPFDQALFLARMSPQQARDWTARNFGGMTLSR